MTRSALFTDFYELTMAQGFWKSGNRPRAVFDYFFRKQPWQGGYSVFAGLEPLLRSLEEISFSSEDLAWLEGLGVFDRGFLDYLASFRFHGDIWAAAEGTVVFPQEPLLRINADLIEAQIVEGLVLNTLNFQSLIATKAARIWKASNYGKIMEFGLRRAQGYDGSLSASRAALIGGATTTSNALAARLLHAEVSGTMAHSWVMSFPTELESFEAYAKLYPNRTVFLIDTYDTLESGIKNAVKVGKTLAAQNKSFGVRLDSGDIDYLSREVRRVLDEAGLRDASIVVSNELDEAIIENLQRAGAPVDGWGVGTHLVTGGTESSFAGVYKLAAVERDGVFVPTMKFSDNPDKSTNPGVKQVWRLYDDEGMAEADLVALEGEEPKAGRECHLHHPSGDWRRTTLVPSRVEALLAPVMEGGVIRAGLPNLEAIRMGLRLRLEHFDSTYLRLLNPHIYKVSISTKLRDQKLVFIRKHMKDGS